MFQSWICLVNPFCDGGEIHGHIQTILQGEEGDEDGPHSHTHLVLYSVQSPKVPVNTARKSKKLGLSCAKLSTA